MQGSIIRGSLAAIATGLCLGTASLHAQQASQVKVTILVAETPVTGVPDKVFVLLTAARRQHRSAHPSG